MDAYQNLANAIIIQAAKDYRAALKILKKNSYYEKAQLTKKECERFFLSGWFGVLSCANGEEIMKAIQKEVA